MLYKYLVSVLLCMIPFTVSAYSLVTKVVDGHMVRIFVIPPDDSYRVTAVASNSATSLQNLIESASGVAGINGAYFIPRDYTGHADSSNTVRIVGHDGFSFSRYYPDTGINGIFGFTSDALPILVQNNIYGESSLRDNYHANELLELESGIANFPILLANWVNLVPRYDTLWLITDKMKAKNTKSFICRTTNNDVKMGTINSISLLEVPALIAKFGCLDAINLDNGGSLALRDRGKYILGPGRNIMDAFIITRK